MTEREKLIALMKAAVIPCPVGFKECKGCPYEDESGDCDEWALTADHLLANGVVVRENGGWELTVDGRGHASLRCHKCGEEMCLSEDNGEETPRFCPWCGADNQPIEEQNRAREGENDG